MPKRLKQNLPLPESNLNRIPQRLFSARVALFLFIFDVVVGVVGFMWLEGYTLEEAFYMVVITVSTVGYTEVRPLSEYGHLFVSFYILFNVGLFAYLLSVFSWYVVNGELFKKMHENLIRKKIEQLHDHVVVCGYGRYGREVVDHFLHHKTPFVIIENDLGALAELQQHEQAILYVKGDATEDEVLLAAGIQRAAALISALPDDSENLFVVLTARQLNAKLNIISRAGSTRSVKKLQLAGANHIVMPEQIGGFYMATLVSKPGATEFFARITREQDADIGFEEISFQNAPAPCRHKSIRELHIRQQTGTNIIGYIDPNGNFTVNPDPDTRLVPGSSFIVIGSVHQLKRLRSYLASMQ